MIRFVIYLALLILLTRALSRLWGGFVEGLTGEPRPRSRVPQRGVQMVRDPVCGTFVVPDRALMLSVGREQLYFCSTACRDKYRAA
jgi:YHS domain-containing protein